MRPMPYPRGPGLNGEPTTTVSATNSRISEVRNLILPSSADSLPRKLVQSQSVEHSEKA